MGSIGYFRTLNALMNLFSLFVCMTYFPYQNANVVEETLSASKSDAILFQTTLPLLEVLLKSLPIILPLCCIQHRVLRMAL